jgi:hypothetical protein
MAPLCFARAEKSRAASANDAEPGKKPTMRKKTSLTIGLVIVFAVVGLAIYFLVNNPPSPPSTEEIISQVLKSG